MVWISLKRDEDCPKKLVAMAGSGANLPPKGRGNTGGARMEGALFEVIHPSEPLPVVGINHENVGKYICIHIQSSHGSVGLLV